MRAWMIRLTVCALFCAGMVFGVAAGEPAGGDGGVPHFQEVLRLLRQHLPGVEESELNAAMVEGLTGHFGNRVVWVRSGEGGDVAGEGVGLRRWAFYEGGVGYLGVEHVGAGLGSALREAMASLRASNVVSGWVVDLRFAGGRDYRAVVGAAEPFVRGGEVLLKLGGEEMRSGVEAGDELLPVVVFVNDGTRGAAEALAGVLREAGPAVVMGVGTAGEAQAYEEHDLEGGGSLWVASAPVLVGAGRSLEGGVVPDLVVEATEARQRIWLVDPFGLPEGEKPEEEGRAARFDEAALVAQHGGVPVAGGGVEEDEPVMRDIFLVRALALLKGLERVRGGILR